jgi:hypothetical protein
LVGAVIAIVLIGFEIAYPIFSNQIGMSNNQGLLAVQLTDPPVVPPGVTSVVIQYSDVFADISNAGDAGRWYRAAGPGSIDLMSVVNVSQTIVTSPVPVGTYNAIRFNITSATVTFNDTVYSATVPSGWIRVPLRAGGTRVTPTADSGVVIDMAPTVLLVNENGDLHFIVMPVVRGFPVPGSFQKSLEGSGAREDRSDQKFLNQEEREDIGNIIIQSAFLNKTSLTITVKNIGAADVTLTLAMLVGLSQYSVTSGNLTIYSDLRSYQIFAVLANESLEVAQSRSQLISQFQSGQLGYHLASGASMTLSYTNSSGIQLISPLFELLEHHQALVAQTQSIIPGDSYGLAVRGNFEADAFMYLTAA